MTQRPHGYARYRLDGCRCYTCAFARSEYDANRTRAIAYGTWQPYVDAAPVRAHIQVLQDFDMGTRRIAALAGCDRKRITAITTGRSERGTGPQERIRPALASAILAVEPALANLAPHTVMDATGTVRRLRALVAAGWPQAHIGAQLGISPSNFTATINAQRLTVRTVLAVRGLYDHLWAADPATAGASAAGVTRARRYAAGRGWAPGAAWDDDTIDDPAAQPDWTGKCGTPEGYSAHFVHRILPTCQPCRTARSAVRRAARRGAAAFLDVALTAAQKQGLFERPGSTVFAIVELTSTSYTGHADGEEKKPTVKLRITRAEAARDDEEAASLAEAARAMYRRRRMDGTLDEVGSGPQDARSVLDADFAGYPTERQYEEHEAAKRTRDLHNAPR